MTRGSAHIIVVGAGPAGTWAAIAAKRHAPSADVTLLSDDPTEPYEKPPLSKGVLLGTARPRDALIAGPQGVRSNGVTLEAAASCTAIDRAHASVSLTDGRQLAYDALVLATGAVPRTLTELPPTTAGVYYLRTAADALALKQALRVAHHLVVIGGGLIGLEVAAAAAILGVNTTVLEYAPRVLARVCDVASSDAIAAAHAGRGVVIRLGCRILHTEGNRRDGFTIRTDQGSFRADVVVVGIGSVANDALAREAGLHTANGIIVNECCRTSDPAIYAAGDVALFPGPQGLTRLENWRHAQEQGIVAGRNAAGAADSYASVPSFWSEQYDLYLQEVGWTTAGITKVRRPLPDARFIEFDVLDGRLTRASGINVQRDLAAARRLIERRTPVVAEALQDPAVSLARMLSS